MTCRISEETLYEYLDGELEALNILVLEEHLRTCENCQTKMEQIRALTDELDSWARTDFELPEELHLIGRRVYMESTGKSFTLDDFLKSQVAAWNGPRMFLNNLPGRKAAGKTVNALSRSLAKTSGSLIKRSYKLATARK